MKRFVCSVFCMCLISSAVPADCPSADTTGDCKVNIADLGLLTSQWLDEGIPIDPCHLVWVYVDDPGAPGHEPFSGYISKYETTNAQYCTYLNAALDSDDIVIQEGDVYGSSGPYDGEIYYDLDSPYAQISYSGCEFVVETRDGYSMTDHPVVEVSWYGATAFCGYYGYRLPTEWEWHAVADYDGTFTYGCGTSIDHDMANYDFGNPLGLSDHPYTSPVDHYPSYGYGMNDMAGNVHEWTSTVSDEGFPVLRGGGWSYAHYYCTLISWGSSTMGNTSHISGFRVCR